MAGPDLSGKSGCEMRRNPGNRHREVRIRHAKKSGQSARGSPNSSGYEIRICPENPDVKYGEIRAITMGISEFVQMRNPDLSRRTGCEIRINPGNHIGDLRKNPDAKSGFFRKMRM